MSRDIMELGSYSFGLTLEPNSNAVLSITDNGRYNAADFYFRFISGYIILFAFFLVLSTVFTGLGLIGFVMTSIFFFSNLTIFFFSNLTIFLFFLFMEFNCQPYMNTLDHIKLLFVGRNMNIRPDNPDKFYEIINWLNENQIKYGLRDHKLILLNKQDIIAVKLQFE